MDLEWLTMNSYEFNWSRFSIFICLFITTKRWLNQCLVLLMKEVKKCYKTYQFARSCHEKYFVWKHPKNIDIFIIKSKIKGQITNILTEKTEIY